MFFEIFFIIIFWLVIIAVGLFGGFFVIKYLAVGLLLIVMTVYTVFKVGFEKTIACFQKK